MAYNQSSGSRDFGDLKYETDTDTQLDWEEDYIGLKTGGTTRLAISGSAGNVGIGTTNPSHTLQIDSNSGVEGLQVNGDANQYVASFRASTTTGQSYGPYVRAGTNSSDAALIVDNAAGSTSLLKLTGEGKLGIGIASPTDELTVAGDISGSGVLKNVGAAKFGASVFVTGSVTAGNSFIIGSANINETDLEKLDGITDGTATANKAVVVDGSKNIATLGTVGCGAITSTGTSTFNNISGSGTLKAGTDVTFQGLASGSAAGPGSFVSVDAVGKLVLTESAGGGISFNGSTANGVVTYGGATQADVEANMTFDGNTLTATNASNTAIPAIKIDRDYTGTTSIGNYTTDPQGLLIDYDVTGIVATGQTAIHDALAIHFNQDSATQVGTLESTGIDCKMTGGASGTQSMKGVAINLAGADTNTGIDITVPNDGTHLVARSPDHLLDQFKISVGAAGATTLSTNDADAAAAHLTCSVDGNIVLDPAGSNVIVDGNLSASINISASAFYVEDQIVHTGDPDTYITFTTDDINFQAGGVNFLDLTEDTQNEVTFNEAGVDIDFRVETADESHMLFIEGSSNRMSIGDNTGSPGATVEIKNHASAGAFGVPLLQLNNNDTDQQCVDINAGNIDANVVNITANDVTTARVLAIGADGLTTGNALYVDDNSANTGTRNTALIIQNNAAAINAQALAVQSDGGTTGIKLDKNYSDLTEASITGLHIDWDKTGASTSDNTMYGIQLDMDNTTATNGNNYMYGLHVTPTLTHAADAGGAFLYGAFINAQGGTNGSSLVQGARIEAGGGDVNYGLQLDVEDGGVDLRIESSADSGDYFQIQTTTHGATTITTVDDDAAAADLTFTIDGNMTLDPAGTALFNSDLGIGGTPTLPLDVQSTSPAAGRLANTANDAYGSLLRLQNTRAGSNAGQANDFCGGVVFMAQDSTATGTQYGKITTKVGSPTNTSEAGFMTFEVTTGGTLATEYLRMDGGTNAITSSVTTRVTSDLIVDATVDIGTGIDSDAKIHVSGSDSSVLAIFETPSNPIAMAITGSGQVVVGGLHLDAKLNVSGSDTDKLISLKSDTKNPAFYASGSGDVYVAGKVGIGTTDPSMTLDVNANAIRIRTAGTPSSASDLGVQGEIRWDASYIYICVATDTWKRVAIDTW